jgi:hypothetical protein
MEYTNVARLPKSVFYVLTQDNYEPEGLGVTTLIDSPRIRILKEKHEAEIVRDATENVHLKLGEAFHALMESYPDGVQEQRFCAEVEDQKVCGIPDLIEDQTIIDYKVSSAYIHIFGIREEWVSQQNIYRWLLRQNDVVVNKMQIVVLFKDWSKSMVDRRQGYPPYPFGVYDVPMWTLKDTEEFLKERVRLHLMAEEAIPLCTPEERWQKDGNFAVYQPSSDNARRVLDNEYDARMWIAKMSGSMERFPMINEGDKRPTSGYFIERRPDEWKRCEDYCDVKDFCLQYKRFCESQGQTADFVY